MFGRSKRRPYWIVRNHHRDRLEVIQGNVPSVLYEASGPFAHELKLLQTRVDGPIYDSGDAAIKLQWWAKQHREAWEQSKQ